MTSTSRTTHAHNQRGYYRPLKITRAAQARGRWVSDVRGQATQSGVTHWPSHSYRCCCCCRLTEKWRDDDRPVYVYANDPCATPPYTARAKNDAILVPQSSFARLYLQFFTHILFSLNGVARSPSADVNYTVSQKTSPTYLTVTWEPVIRFW